MLKTCFLRPKRGQKKLSEMSHPHTPTPIDGKTYDFDDVM